MFSIASVLKKLGSHGDHRLVLLVCQDEKKIGYHRLLYEQVSLVTTMLAGYTMQSKLTSLSEITDNNVSCEIKDQT